MTERTIGIDIGGTKTSAGIVDERGLVAHTLLTERTPASDGPDEIVRLLVRMVRSLDRVTDAEYPIGVGAAGVVDGRGVVLSATDAIANWRGFDLRGSLVHGVQRSVRILNDVHAAAVGEARLGAGSAFDSFLMVSVGTGIGGAICRNGVPDFGATGTAGSVGHTAARNQEPRPCSCGQSGHLEAYASGPAMERAYAEVTGHAIGLREIAALAQAHDGRIADPAAERVLRTGAEILGIGLADALNLIDVDAIIVGGGVAAIGPGYLDVVARSVANAALPGPAAVSVRAALLGTEATLVGAGNHARESASSSISHTR